MRAIIQNISMNFAANDVLMNGIVVCVNCAN